MRDITSQSRLQQLHPDVRAEFKKFIETCEDALNVTIRIVQGLRTFEEQDAIYQQGRTKPGPIVSNARAGSSYHNYGLAIDIGVLVNGKIDWNFDYKRFQLFMPKGMVWGADWDHDGKTKADGDKDEHLVDMPHYQLTFGYTWQQLLAKYNNKDFIAGTHYIKMETV